MGNTQFADAERTCGKFPSPAVKRRYHHHERNAVSSLCSVDMETLRRQEQLRSKPEQQGTSETTESSSKPATATTTDNTSPTTEPTTTILGSIVGTIAELFDPKEPERLPPKRFAPKQRLWGCTTTDEHFEYIETICEIARDLNGREGLLKMGFEYRWVHHDMNCTCFNDAKGDHSSGGNGSHCAHDDHRNENIAIVKRKTSGDLLLCDDGVEDDLTDSEAGDDDEEQKERNALANDSGYDESSESGEEDDETPAVARAGDDKSGDGDGDDAYGFVDLESTDGRDQEFLQPIKGDSFMVPIGESLKESLKEHKDEKKYAAPTAAAMAEFPELNNNFPPSYMMSSINNINGNNAKTMSRASSVVSLFSLATHNTDFSNPTNASSARRSTRSRASTATPSRQKQARFPLASITNNARDAVMEQDSCALRLFHIPSGTMMTPKNHLEFMADGKMYDQLARLCMEHAQEVMMEEGNLQWIMLHDNTTSNGTTTSQPPQKGSYGAIVSRSFLERMQNNNKKKKKKHKTLLVVTGKGEVKCGIFSRRHLLVTSMDAGTALPFIRGAKERDMEIVMLDPNARGWRVGMDTVESSLDKLFLDRQAQQQQPDNDENANEENDNEEEVYILAHSMAGAQIVRFFTSNSSSYSRPPTPASCASSISESSKSNGGPPPKGAVTVTKKDSSNSDDSANNNNGSMDRDGRKANFLQRIKAMAFTDSNHNINWTKKHPYLAQVLTGPPSLYIKSHKVHEKAKSLGDKHHDCQFWKHRFGDIKTLWAGTHEHALTNYTARDHIWEHFDSFLKDSDNENGNTQNPQ